MPKRNRVRARARRPIESAPRAERAEGERPERPMRLRSRAATGPVLATDAASPALERAAAAERAYVLKDARKLAMVAGVMVGLLVLSGFGVDRLLR